MKFCRPPQPKMLVPPIVSPLTNQEKLNRSNAPLGTIWPKMICPGDKVQVRLDPGLPELLLDQLQTSLAKREPAIVQRPIESLVPPHT